jgi:hypothetical protein
MFPKHGVDNADYTVQHDIFTLSAVELFIAPEYRRDGALAYSAVGYFVPEPI